MTHADISVVITAYNRPAFVKEAIEGVLAQTLAPLEIIVIDDCSPTSLESAVAAFGEKVRYHRQAENGGANVARNKGVELAQGRYIAFHDDDDIWLPEKLERQLAAIGDRQACLCGGKGMFRGQLIAKREDHIIRAEDFKHGGWYCGTTGLFALRSAMLATPFDTALTNGQDWDVYVRLAQQGELAYVSEPLFLFRDGEHERITNNAKKLTVDGLKKRTEVTFKHRDWLGEKAFRRRIANVALSYIWDKQDRLGFVAYAMRHAGPVAIMGYVKERAMSRFGDPEKKFVY